MRSIELSKDLDERLDFMANRSGKTVSDFIRDAILERIEDMEDVMALERALARSDGTTVSWEEAMAEWDLKA
jgi:RHH-type transcriptional regulator, rel operon repressor / antitoxin RelB